MSIFLIVVAVFLTGTGLGFLVLGLHQNTEGDPRDVRNSVIGISLIGAGVIVGALTGIYAPGVSYSNGSRIGYVTKLSKKGIFWETWEGDMQVGGLTPEGAGTMASESWQFSVSDDVVAKQVETAMLASRRIKLNYHEYVVRGVSLGSTGYDIVGVEEVTK